MLTSFIELYMKAYLIFITSYLPLHNPLLLYTGSNPIPAGQQKPPVPTVTLGTTELMVLQKPKSQFPIIQLHPNPNPPTTTQSSDDVKLPEVS